MDKKSLTAFVRELEAAAQEIAAKHNFTFGSKGGTIGSSSTVLKFEVRELTESGAVAISPLDRTLLVQEINHPDVTEENVEGFAFKYQGVTYQIRGFNAKASKNVISISDASGRLMRCGGGYVRQALSFQPVKRMI